MATANNGGADSPPLFIAPERSQRPGVPFLVVRRAIPWRKQFFVNTAEGCRIRWQGKCACWRKGGKDVEAVSYMMSVLDFCYMINVWKIICLLIPVELILSIWYYWIVDFPSILTSYFETKQAGLIWAGSEYGKRNRMSLHPWMPLHTRLRVPWRLHCVLHVSHKSSGVDCLSTPYGSQKANGKSAR